MHIKMPGPLGDILVVSLGAAAGANARYWLGAWLSQRLASTFPYATLIINVTGSLALGFIMTLATQRYLVDPRLRIALTVGFLGAYTTFSTYEYESVNLMLAGQWGAGLLNLGESAIVGAIAVGAGVVLARIV
jgi:fluoride exporter